MFGRFGATELIILGVVALLIFGRRLPEVGRSLGRGLVEFKKGLSGIEDDVNKAGTPQEKTQERQITDASSQQQSTDVSDVSAQRRAQES